MTKLGYHIIDFTLPAEDSATLFDSVVAQAKEAEDAGVDRVSVMDHFFQLPALEQPQEPMFECYTLLSALA